MSFTDFLKVQRFVAHALLSDEWLENVNVATRDFILANSSQLPDETLAAEVLVYITERNGRSGCGIIVEKPEFRVDSPNLPGPQGDLILTCLILADRITNEGPTTGTNRPANQVGQRILELCHNWRIHPGGAFFANQNALTEAKDFAPLDAWRVSLRMKLPRAQNTQVAEPTITADGLEIALACATADAEIFYTTDESMPAHERGGNPGSHRYTAPFTVESGDVVNVCAYKTDLIQSNVITTTVP